MTPYRPSLGDLKRWRAETRTSQQKLAEVVGCLQQTVNAIEKRRMLPSPALAERIELATGGRVKAAGWRSRRELREQEEKLATARANAIVPAALPEED